MMSTEVIGVLIAALALNGTLIAFAIRQASRQAKIEVKVDTLWDLFIDRAASKAAINQLAKANSPLVVSKEAKALYDNLRPDLRAFYLAHQSLTCRDLWVAMQQKFGARLLNEIVLPHKIDYDDALWIAIELAKGNVEAVGVLIVDDDTKCVEVLRRLIEQSFRNVTVHDKSTLLEAITFSNETPAIDLVILDLHLGDSPSAQTVEHIRDFNKPVICYSAMDSDELAALCYQKGAIDFIAKGTLAELQREKLARALSRFADISFAAVQRESQEQLKQVSPSRTGNEVTSF